MNVSIGAGRAAMRGHLALPGGTPTGAGWPGLVVIHDITGFGRDVKRIANRLADCGYAALAPAMYDGAGARPLCVIRTLNDHRRKHGPAFERIEAARSHLAEQVQVDQSRIGIVGFCMGGAFALFYAARGGLGACAPFYGETARDPEQIRGICPVIAGYGETDTAFVKYAERLERQLEQLQVPHDVKVYPGVGHSYMNRLPFGRANALVRHLPPLRAGYDHDAAEDSWQRMIEFFGQHLSARDG
jgi:carboxymethylenebutenolidase